ncbi:uncharacterized protein [Neodiprion pinetum]|uniref:uncharacterized protein n=1 Tax=Neodiprion pinetum TaxID=441929 RepID=UPI001EE14C15|nr:uncharacterized protein LOC124212268 [Neodiprion pinetum]
MSIEVQSPFSNVKDSCEFVNKIQNLNIPDDHLLVSLDVTYLFTNVPTDLAIDAVSRKCDQIKNNIQIPLDQLVWINITFKNVTYSQTFGFLMGSPLSPILSDLVMEDLKTRSLNSLKFKTTFYHRYVDDILLTVPSGLIDCTVSDYNQYHERLQFTFEVEANNRISLLDRYMNFESHHPTNQKVANIYNLLDRGILLTDYSFHSKNIYLIKHVLALNNYPEKLVNRCIKN